MQITYIFYYKKFKFVLLFKLARVLSIVCSYLAINEITNSFIVETNFILLNKQDICMTGLYYIK